MRSQEREIEHALDKHVTEFLLELGAGFAFVGRQVLLCKSKNKVVAEYALADKSQPMGIAEYKLLDSLPAELQTNLPSIESIEQALADEAAGDEA